MKNILIASDSFKGTISSIEVGNIVKDILSKKYKDLNFVTRSIADGGEGMIDSISYDVGCKIIQHKAYDPLGREIDCKFGILDHIAIIESAQTAGLPLLESYEKNPALTNTYGVGQQILKALEFGIKKIIIGIGGTSTTDAGMGLMQAIGATFFDKNNNIIERVCGNNLNEINKIETSGINKKIYDVEIIIASDVNNPLYGENGASYIYAPQKGADELTVEALDKNLKHVAEIIKNDYKIDVQKVNGSGAGGGLPTALYSFLNAKIVSGINLLMDLLKIEEDIKSSDLIITGEGKFDNQSLMGKVINGITSKAEEYNKPVIIICGLNDFNGKNEVIKDIYSIVPSYSTLEDSFKNPQDKLKAMVESIDIKRYI